MNLSSAPGASKSMASLLIIDGDNLIHRAYHANPKSITDKDGRPFNAISGFFSSVVKVTRDFKPARIFIAWDTPPYETYRNELWPAYQTGREFDNEIREQLVRLPDLCRACGFGVGAQAGYEADDMGATACRLQQEAGGECLILTTDKDNYQLVNERVNVLSPVRGKPELERIGVHQVVEKLGVLPQQVPDFKALAGDSSDRIPGIQGIGPKSAAALLLKLGTLERIVESWANPANIELAMRFKKVTTMQTNANVSLPKATPEWRSGAKELRKLGAGALATRMEELAQ